MHVAVISSVFYLFQIRYNPLKTIFAINSFFIVHFWSAMLHSIFGFIFFSCILIIGKCESIFCYHGESYDTLSTNISTIHCSSGKCIMFSSACNSYWATTCYNERKPLALVMMFRNIRKYYNVTTLTNRMFSICNISGCNYNKLSPFLQPINKVPISFDSLLWTKLGNEKPKNTLQNGFKFLNGLFANERFEFVGKTFEHGKNIWIKADFSGLNNTIITYRVDFNLSESTYVIKTIVKSPKKNAAFQNKLISSTEKHAFNAKKFVGEKLTIALKNNGRNYEFYLDFIYFNLPIDLQSLLLVQYGGNWIAESSKIIKEKLTNGSTCTKECETSYGMVPTFDIPKPSIFNCTLNSTNEASVNTTLKYVYIGDKTAQGYGTTMGLKYGLTTDLTLKQNELIEYEIRESLCANSNLVKIQIQNIQSLNNTSTNTTYSFNIWKRFNSIWIFVENFKKEAEICISNNIVHFEGNGFTFSCNNTIIYFSNLQFYSYYAFVKANYVVEGIPQKINCNIK